MISFLPKLGGLLARLPLGKLIAIQIPGRMHCQFGNGRTLW
jgi:hypothetical protein